MKRKLVLALIAILYLMGGVAIWTTVIGDDDSLSVSANAGPDVLGDVEPSVTSVKWYFKDTDASGLYTGHESDRFMSKIVPTKIADDIVTLGPTDSAWWYTVDVADYTLPFPEGDWIIRYWAEIDSDDDERVYSRVIRVSADGTIEILTSTGIYENVKSSDGVKEIVETVHSGATDFLPGDRIAVEIKLSSGAVGEELTVYFDSISHDSSLTAPVGSPSWPIPELPVIVLFIIGLMVVVSMLIYVKLKESSQVELCAVRNRENKFE